jgi:hypothetical protein
MTYLVRVEGGDYHERGHHHSLLRAGVRKRYSDFLDLRRRLVARYSSEGLLVPPLPPKRTGTQDADFVKRRMSGLALFLESLAASPFFSVDAAVEAFATTTTESNGTIGGGRGCGSMDLDEEAVLRGLDGSAGGGSRGAMSPRNSNGLSAAAAPGSNRGYQLWHEHLAGFANPPQPDALLAKVCRESLLSKQMSGADRGRSRLNHSTRCVFDDGSTDSTQNQFTLTMIYPTHNIP